MSPFSKSLFFLTFSTLLSHSSVSMGYAVVPKCNDFNLNDLIKNTGDYSPDYQCEINSNLSRASQPNGRWIQSLSNPSIREIPFRSVVNLRAEDNSERSVVLASGMIPKHIPVRDLHAPQIGQVIEFLKFVKDPNNQPDLVHCKAGQGRTGTFIGAYRMAIEKASLEESLREAKSFNVGEEQLIFLRAFYQKLHDGQIEF